MSKKDKPSNKQIKAVTTAHEETKDLLYLTETVLKGVAVSIDEIATHVLDNAKILQDANEDHLSILGRFSTEMAWMLYAAVALNKSNMEPLAAAVFADTLFAEQKKRFTHKEDSLCVPTCIKSSLNVNV